MRQVYFAIYSTEIQAELSPILALMPLTDVAWYKQHKLMKITSLLLQVSALDRDFTGAWHRRKVSLDHR